MKWGECNFSELKKLQKQINDAVDGGLIEDFMKNLLEDIGNLAIQKVKRRTRKISNTGNLMRNWKATSVRKVGNFYIIDIYNNVEYASFVENGFRAHWVPGRWEGNVFVYDRDSKEGMYVGKNSGGWVEGKFMLKISIKEVENQMQQIVDSKSMALLKRIFNEGG